MKPIHWVIAGVLGVAIAGGWTYLQQRGDTTPERADSVASASSVAPVPSVVSAEHPADAAVAEHTVSAGDQVTRWIGDVDSTDAATRTAAITALARAPRAQSLPVLRRVLLNGEPTLDRPLALKSLRELAVTQGDADNGVRQVMREVIYHGDDEQLAAGAQDALDSVEQAELKLAQQR